MLPAKWTIGIGSLVAAGLIAFVVSLDYSTAPPDAAMPTVPTPASESSAPSRQVVVAANAAAAPAPRRAQPFGLPQVAVCERVIDGDTIKLDCGETVRLMGVDTPETVDPRKPVERFGKEASEHTRAAVEGQTVRMEYDPANAMRGHRDPYGRLLAYVYLADGTDLSAKIIQDGYGHADTRFPCVEMDQYVALERQAREAKRGLWAPDEPVPIATAAHPAPSAASAPPVITPPPVAPVRPQPTLLPPPAAPPVAPYVPPPSYTTPRSSGGTVHVRGYYRRDGTYVQPYTRRAPSR